MKNLNLLKSIVFLCLISLSQGLMAQNLEFPVQSHSPIPELWQPGMLPLDSVKSSKATNKTTKMRVLVYPHTLKRDYRHGIPDDPKTVEFKSEQNLSLYLSNGEKLNSDHAKVNLEKGKMTILLADGSEYLEQKSLLLKSSQPISVLRSLNLDKTHRYNGTLELIIRNDELRLINEVPIEEYLRGVVPSEAINTWPLESLKAQAVAARTYAYYHFQSYKMMTDLGEKAKRPWQVDDTARFQVYTGLSHVSPETDLAVQETSHEIMTYQGNIIIAYFHSYSGGRTDSAFNIFDQTDAPYCAGDLEVFTREELLAELSPNAQWIVNWTTDEYSDAQLLNKLKSSSRTGTRFEDFDLSQEVEISVLSKNPDFQSVNELQFVQGKETAVINYKEVRSAIGWADFPSYHFRLNLENDTTSFSGNGWGHHVGMSQWGAFMMAKHHAKTYRDILHHYYSGIEISEFK